MKKITNKMTFYSQYEQDKWLYNNYFKNKKNGIFLEIGADDGIDKSNTKLFEDLGWSGICIEPSPDRFKLLKNNRKCICENFAISNSIGESDFMDISGWGKGLSGIINKYDERHKSRIKQELQHPNNKGKKIIKVKTELLSNILDKHDINNIDFCTIDTEGGEIDIIKTIDFNKYNIDIILIENNYNEDHIRKYLEKYDYLLVTKLGVDDVFIKSNKI